MFAKLEKNKILKEIKPSVLKFLNELLLLDQVDSTNDYLLRLIDRYGVACFAEQQTAGKGQRGKQWVSPPGQIYFSLSWLFQKPPAKLLGLSLAIGIAAVRVLHGAGASEGLKIKWPNDVYYQGQKIVGILVETVPDDAISKAVIGIGVNLFSHSEQTLSINQPWTSLDRITHQTIDRNVFAGKLLNECLKVLEEFNLHGLAPFLEEWRGLDFLYGKRVTVSHGQQMLVGWTKGVSNQGELLLVDDLNQEHSLLNGTVRLI